MMSKLNDLLFLIGLFLTLIGGVVMGAYIFGSSDVVQGIHVNLLGGSMLMTVGIVMIAMSYMAVKE
jgi:hypothetical protein